MFKSARLNTLLHYALCLLAFSIPTWYIFSSISLALVTLLWLLQFDYRQTVTNIKERRNLWPWFIMYLLLIASYFYSDDKGQAAFDLKTKLAYLILPLIIGAGIGRLRRKTTERLFIWLIAGVAFTAIICLIDAAIIWYPENYYYSFFYHQLVRIVDPNAVYTAWYTIFSISLLLFMPWKYNFQGKNKHIKNILIIFLLIFFLLLSARMFILLLLLFIIPYFIKKSFRNLKTGIVVLIVTAGVIISLFKLLDTTNNPIRNRYYEMIYNNQEIAWLTDYTGIKEEQFDNLTLRLFLWRIGLESIADRNAWFTGLGNGDVHLILRQKMKDYKVTDIDNKDITKRPAFYNANLHNMYIQTMVMIGIPGFIALMCIVVLPFFYIHKVIPYQPFMVFHITSIIFMMQEAVLQTQAGIFFYILISSIFWNMYYSSKEFRHKLI